MNIMADATEDKKSVSETTRDIVAGTAEKAKDLKDKTVDMAGRVSERAGEKWEDMKPLREKAGERLDKAAQAVAGFGTEAKEGFKEGIAKAQAAQPDGNPSDGNSEERPDMHT